MAKKRKKNELEKAYDKQVRRIKQIVSRETKKGFIFPDEVVPPKPKRITAGTLRRLEKITPEVVRGKSYVVTEEGEVLSYRAAKKAGQVEERKGRAPRPVSPYKGGLGGGGETTRARSKEGRRRSQRPPQGPIKVADAGYGEEVLPEDDTARIMYENFRSTILSHAWGEGGQYLYRFLQDLERQYTDREMAEFINSALQSGFELQNYMYYDGNEALKAINYLMDFLPLNQQQIGNLNELTEFFDDWEELL